MAYSENSAGVYILSSELMARTEYAEWVNSVLDHPVTVDADKGDVMNWREQPMAEDAVQLVLEELPEKDATVPVALGCLALLILGAAWGTGLGIYHRKEKRR